MMKIDKLLELSASTVAFIRSAEEESSPSADESHNVGWKLQQFIYFHRDISTPAMSIDSNQVGDTLFPSC